jgi:hypothetical protein
MKDHYDGNSAHSEGVKEFHLNDPTGSYRHWA